MRARGVTILGALLLSVAASCRFPISGAPSCDNDLELCPHSSSAATSVTCDCRCTIGVNEETGVTYAGAFAVCLPPALNGATASDAERTTLQALGARELDQRIYRYCSRDVARFVRTTIKLHSLLRLAACLQPVTCECSTTGTDRDTSVCRKGCEEKPCDERNCSSVLRTSGRLDMSGCACTRASVCNVVSPPEDGPSMCRDWLTPTNKAPSPEAPSSEASEAL